MLPSSSTAERGLFSYLGTDQFDIVLLPQDRIEIIQANIADRPDVVISADVIIMNNVFEFFLEPDEQISVWSFLRQTIKPGTLLVTVPPLEETFSHLQVCINVQLQYAAVAVRGSCAFLHIKYSSVLGCDIVSLGHPIVMLLRITASSLPGSSSSISILSDC
jgi:hypothetical protein